MVVLASHRMACPVVLRYKLSESFVSRTSLSLSLVCYSEHFCYKKLHRISSALQPCNKLQFRLFPFRSPLLRESLMIFFPGATEMFQFTPCPPKQVYIHCWIILCKGTLAGGLPHSETAGSKVYNTSPTSIAVICVLPRPMPPRHPLLAL